ncbi:MAG: ATP-dependent Clp protease ATP-binding subunit [Armatimonadota bacterium]|nr:ATP-dependent Clp protease ATP-binding subunit [Armatimonadota bacterium]
MWQRFTDRAKRVVFFAQEEAAHLGENYVSPEHLLLGLVREGDSVAARVLDRLGVPPSRVRAEVERRIVRGEGRTTQDMTLDPRARKVLDLAYDEARQLNNNHIGTEHLLLGLIREGDGLAARILSKLGVDLLSARREVIAYLGGDVGSTPTRQRSKTPTLDEFGRDLTQLARDDKLDPVVGRNREIERVIQILSRRTKNNPVLIGEPGVGKTAVAEGLAQRIVRGDIPEPLKDKRVISLDLAGLVAGTKYRGEFEERMKRVMEEIRRAQGEVVLFVDELHTLVGAGAAEGAIDASNILKPSLARGEMQCIGATTMDEYRKYIERDGALARRFQQVLVDEPTVEETVDILKGLRPRYESHHKVRIADDAVASAARLSSRYITDRFLPDKAIDVLDEASSRVRLRATLPPPEIRNLKQEIEELQRERDEAQRNYEYETVAAIREKILQLQARLNELEEEWRRRQSEAKLVVDEEEVAQIVAAWTGVPVTRLVESETTKLLRMEEHLHKRIIGQDEPVNAVARAIRRARSGLKDPKRPTGSFIFLGPTGVGKTELARALAEFLFDDETAMVRIDMSEYMERFAVSRLVGAPPGYVGYDEGGQLTEAVRRRPYSVVLLDEIEKAHPEVFNILLQVMEDGRLTDSQGRVVDFRNTVIIMTSNVGAGTIQEDRMGLRRTTGTEEPTERQHEAMKKRVMEELKKTFRPEFLNRVDEIVFFHALTSAEIKQIVGLMMNRVAEQLRQHRVEMVVTDAATELLAKEGFDPQYGARPLRRAIQRLVEDPLSEDVLLGTFQAGDTIRVDADGDKIVFSKVRKEVPVAAGSDPEPAVPLA